MDFFDHQDVARKKTGQLVLLFVLSVVCIGAALYVLGVGVEAWATQDRQTHSWTWEWANPVAGFFALALLACIVGGGTLYKLAQLRAGGQVVARELGGRLVTRDTADASEQRVLNVVEEMALASGTPVPPLYVMDHERGINAFAAGYGPETAVIGVTRGAVDTLTRSQMQGVIAHEFSHILNGDMRLNIRLIGVLNGILLLGIIGSMILRSMFYSAAFGGARVRSRSSNDKGGGMIVIVAIGVVLIVLGAIGTFFGTWIKSAVSRQREFLADASAVQFTRDPQTIAGALRTIGGFKYRSRIVSPHAPEASHMFFGQGVSSGFYNMFASHPPLSERIKRVDPSWDGTFPTVGEPAYPSESGGTARDGEPSPRERLTSQQRRAARLGAIGDALAMGVSPGEFMGDGAAGSAGAMVGGVSALASIGTIDKSHVAHAQTLLRAIPDPIRDATENAYSARAVVFGLLLNDDEPYRSEQLEWLRTHANFEVTGALTKLLPSFEQLDRALRLPILDITTPALATMTKRQAEQFLKNARALADADEKLDVFEWALLRMVERRLSPVLGAEHRTRVKYYGLNRLQEELSVLLSALARAGHADEEHARVAFEHASTPLRVPGMAYKSADESGLDRLGEALVELAQTAAREKKQVVTSCAACISADRTITPNEAELFRVIADELGVPTPPVLAGQALV